MSTARQRIITYMQRIDAVLDTVSQLTSDVANDDLDDVARYLRLTLQDAVKANRLLTHEYDAECLMGIRHREDDDD